jgi:hypothetical protein
LHNTWDKSFQGLFLDLGFSNIQVKYLVTEEYDIDIIELYL